MRGRTVWGRPLMRSRSLKKAVLADLAIAAAIAGLVVGVVPGLAIVGMLALLAMVVGGASFVAELNRARRRSRRRFQEGR